MSSISVTVDHPEAHEPDAETFADDFSKGITKSLHALGLKRAQGAEPKIVGYVQTSGVSTIYDVDIDTEPSAAGSGEPKADAKASK